jgi:hypothetical protein
MPRNHKILGILEAKDGYRTAFVWTCSLAYSGEQGTAGFIPRSALPFIHARMVDIDRLVEARLLIPAASGGGWDIHDWAEFQPTTEEHEKRSQRARDAAAVRWAKKAGKK